VISLTEVLFSEAIDHAKRLDEYMSKHGQPIGPLHGVPMTLKDQFNVQGHDTTLGYTARAFKPASTDSVLVGMLRKLGAVIIAKTNLPQSIMVRTPVNRLGFRLPHIV
jgi:Asp-tRNA(Asn)/Glu-tRNA(Gln) amidotransferase A subunit family amidase